MGLWSRSAATTQSKPAMRESHCDNQNVLRGLTVVHVVTAHTYTHHFRQCRCHSRRSEGQSFFDYSPHCRGFEGKKLLFKMWVLLVESCERGGNNVLKRSQSPQMISVLTSSFPVRQPRTSPLAVARQLKYESTSS